MVVEVIMVRFKVLYFLLSTRTLEGFVWTEILDKETK